MFIEAEQYTILLKINLGLIIIAGLAFFFTTNLVRLIILLEIAFIANAILCFIALKLSDEAESRLNIFVLLNFAAIDAGIGVAFIIMIKKRGNSNETINISKK